MEITKENYQIVRDIIWGVRSRLAISQYESLAKEHAATMERYQIIHWLSRIDQQVRIGDKFETSQSRIDDLPYTDPFCYVSETEEEQTAKYCAAVRSHQYAEAGEYCEGCGKLAPIGNNRVCADCETALDELTGDK